MMALLGQVSDQMQNEALWDKNYSDRVRLNSGLNQPETYLFLTDVSFNLQ